MEYYIDKSAHVSSDAQIGAGTKIWINSQIRENVKIGKNCVVGKDTYIDFEVKIGDNCKVQNGVSIYHGVEIEKDVFIGPNVAFTNDMFPRALNDNFEVKNTLIKEGASLGANSTIICGVIIGKHAMIGAGSVVTKDVENYALIVGNPAKKIGYVCKCGTRINSNKCEACGFVLE